MLLAVENLKMYYGVDGETVKAVDGVDFSLGEAESLGIVGESGCGKSSLAMTLLKILPSNARIVSGRIVLDGMDIVGLPEDKLRREIRWRKVSMVFQGSMNALNPVIKVGEQIAEAIIVHVDGIAKKEALEKAADLLEMVGLDRSTLKRYPFELSGGQRQRAVIAMALALNPRVLIADEPTTALDVIVQAQILKLLKELKERLRLSIVFISHDVSVISEVSNKVAIMYAGKFVESGSTEAVFLNPSHPYTQALISAVPSIKEPKKTFKYIVGQPPSLINPPSGCRFHPRCPYVMDVCRSEEPPSVEVEKEHFAACHLLGEYA